MKAMNTIEVDLDIKINKRECVCFYQNDTNIIDFITCSGGATCSLNNVDNIIVNYKRPDGKIISRVLPVPVDTNVVSYELGITEMSVLGHGNVEIQFYGNGKRLTSYIVDVYIKETIGVNFEYEETLPSLPEQILSEVSQSEKQINDFINQYTDRLDFINNELTLVEQRLNQIDERISAVSNWVSQIEQRTTELLPLVGGTMLGDIIFPDYSMGAVLTSENGTRYRLIVEERGGGKVSCVEI